MSEAVHTDEATPPDALLVRARGVTVQYARRGAAPAAVRGVDLDIACGATVALLGESGSGKTTLGKALLGLVPLAAGSVHVAGVDTTRLRGAAGRHFRRRAQMVFQDATAALNPRMRVRALVADPLVAQRIGSRADRAARVAAQLTAVGLAEALADRFPHELSGGERQRVALARALVLEPELLICDEPVSAVDAAHRLELLDLLAELQRVHQRTLLFITHDPAAAARLADRIVVMHAGRIVESGPARTVLTHPAHPQTRTLWAAVPRLEPAAPRPTGTP
ncbi:MAG TPA: ABC transporter ATP-binding protein [Phycisphaerae bacterium]|nr:ABC transporter ATP-binding protein [Phycisphaerae bacterium]